MAASRMRCLENGAASAGMLWKGRDMAEKDMTEKALKAYNNVFADIVNCLLFHGEERIMEDDLEQCRERSVYLGEKALREQERDTSKFLEKHNIRIAYVEPLLFP